MIYISKHSFQMFFYSKILFSYSKLSFQISFISQKYYLILNLTISIQTHIYILLIQNNQVIQLFIFILTIFQNRNDQNKLKQSIQTDYIIDLLKLIKNKSKTLMIIIVAIKILIEYVVYLGEVWNAYLKLSVHFKV